MVKKIFFFCIFLSTLYSNDFLEKYRVTGIIDLEKNFDLNLTSLDFWNKKLANTDLKFGYSDINKTILYCDKNSSTLSVYIKDSNGSYNKLESYSAFTGKNHGDKEYEGDLKTPIGVYELVKVKKNVDSFYGPLAFVTSYPNVFDKVRDKNGSGIWIHGLPLHQERDSFTKGCIAIENEKLLSLESNISIKNSDLIISQKKIKTYQKEIYTHLLSNLYKWRYNWIYNDFEKYISMYSKEFIRFDKKRYNEFYAFKKAIFAYKDTKKILINNITITPYPDLDSTFMISFFEMYTSKRANFKGKKTLIVTYKDSEFKIIVEK